MRQKPSSVDALVIVPFQPPSALVSLDPKFRQTVGAAMSLPLSTAMLELEAYLGRSLTYWDPEGRPTFDGEPMPFPDHRSLTAVTLATCLEQDGLTWHALDPGTADLDYWRDAITAARSRDPKTVALSTTFITNAPWLRALCAIIRNTLPNAALIVGGYYYATNVKEFLNLDADVLCVGEGEVRLPLIVRRLVAGSALTDIRGLYVRAPDGSLQHTGHVEPLAIAKLPRPDWSLSSRIEPSIDLEQADVEFGVETQRGCVFKCEFCNYRTLASPAAMEPAVAADAIMATARYRRGYINLTDSTASYPHARWEQILEHIVQRGGSPHPIWAFTRVTDLNDARAKLMAAAGVREVFIGQESGDQTILNLMKKGTKTVHIKPAMAALRAAGIGATVSFMHGFPGETIETIQATRRLITELNEPSWSNPTAFAYIVYPFALLDFAAVAQQSQFTGVNHYLGYDKSPISGKRAAEESLATIIAASRKPYAPVYALITEAGPATSGLPAFGSRNREQIFRWLKSVERGMAIFLERELEGSSSGEAELSAIKRTILANLPPRSLWQRRLHSARSRITNSFLRRLRVEWESEAHAGPGLMTRAAVATTLGVKTHSSALLRGGWRTGSVESAQAGGVAGAQSNLAADLIHEALKAPRRQAAAPGEAGGSPVKA